MRLAWLPAYLGEVGALFELHLLLDLRVVLQLHEQLQRAQGLDVGARAPPSLEDVTTIFILLPGPLVGDCAHELRVLEGRQAQIESRWVKREEGYLRARRSREGRAE